MKKIFQSMLMVLLAAFLSVSMTACGDDDDDDDDYSNGKMSGWVKVDGKTYNFKYFMGEKSSDGLEIEFGGSNKDFYNIKPGDRFNFCEFEMTFNSDGTLAINKYGRPVIDFDFVINGTGDEFDPNSIYLDSEEIDTLTGVTATKSGDKLIIDGVNVPVHTWQGSNDSNSTGIRIDFIDFHFEGTPTWGVFN